MAFFVLDYFCPLLKEIRVYPRLYTRTTLVNSLYSRQIVSGVQCSSFKGNTAIDSDGDCERKQLQNGHTNREPTYYYKLSCLIVLATFYGLYFVCLTGTVYAGERDGDKQHYESRDINVALRQNDVFNL